MPCEQQPGGAQETAEGCIQAGSGLAHSCQPPGVCVCGGGGEDRQQVEPKVRGSPAALPWSHVPARGSSGDSPRIQEQLSRPVCLAARQCHGSGESQPPRTKGGSGRKRQRGTRATDGAWRARGASPSTTVTLWGREQAREAASQRPASGTGTCPQHLERGVCVYVCQRVTCDGLSLFPRVAWRLGCEVQGRREAPR